MDKLQYIRHEQGNYLEFKNSDITGTVKYDGTHDAFIINGLAPNTSVIKYWAANPMHRNSSYSGSGLPYPNPTVAYENTPNIGTVQLHDGLFQIILPHPSEYYVNLGKTLLRPHVHLRLEGRNRVITVVLSDYMPYRSLTQLPSHPNRTIGR